MFGCRKMTWRNDKEIVKEMDEVWDGSTIAFYVLW